MDGGETVVHLAVLAQERPTAERGTGPGDEPGREARLPTIHEGQLRVATLLAQHEIAENPSAGMGRRYAVAVVTKAVMDATFIQGAEVC